AVTALVARLPSALQQIGLNLVEQRAQTIREAIHRHALLFARVAARDEDCRLLDVFRSDLHAEGDAAQLPLGELPTGTLVALVECHADACGPELVFDLPGRRQHRLAPVV